MLIYISKGPYLNLVISYATLAGDAVDAEREREREDDDDDDDDGEEAERVNTFCERKVETGKMKKTGK